MQPKIRPTDPPPARPCGGSGERQPPGNTPVCSLNITVNSINRGSVLIQKGALYQSVLSICVSPCVKVLIGSDFVVSLPFGTFRNPPGLSATRALPKIRFRRLPDVFRRMTAGLTMNPKGLWCRLPGTFTQNIDRHHRLDANSGLLQSKHPQGGA